MFKYKSNFVKDIQNTKQGNLSNFDFCNNKKKFAQDEKVHTHRGTCKRFYFEGGEIKYFKGLRGVI